MTCVSDSALIAQLSPRENNDISFTRIYFLRVEWIQLAEGRVYLCILF